MAHFANSTKDQVERIATLGAIVSANPYYPVGFADKYGEWGLGPRRADAMVRAASVSVGKIANLTVLDGDPETIDARRLGEIAGACHDVRGQGVPGVVRSDRTAIPCERTDADTDAASAHRPSLVDPGLGRLSSCSTQVSSGSPRTRPPWRRVTYELTRCSPTHQPH